jgi:multiple sugar transport system permease protein
MSMTTMNAPAARRLRFRRPSPLHLILLPIALVMVTPLLWMVLLSISTEAETRRFPPGLPSGIEWHNYTDALHDAPLGHWLGNSAIVSVSCVAGNLVFCSLAGYAFARIRFLGSRALFVAVLATLMVPFQIVMLPMLIMVRTLGLTDTLGALIVPNLATAFGIFLLRQFFMTVPRELEEAARIDGAGPLRIYWSVMLPLVRPGLVALGVLALLWSWNDLFWPLVVNTDPDKMTLSAGLASLQGQFQTDYPVLMAGSLLASLPVIVVFAFLQRQFVQGIAHTGVKG